MNWTPFKMIILVRSTLMISELSLANVQIQAAVFLALMFVGGRILNTTNGDWAPVGWRMRPN